MLYAVIKRGNAEFNHDKSFDSWRQDHVKDAFLLQAIKVLGLVSVTTALCSSIDTLSSDLAKLDWLKRLNELVKKYGPVSQHVTLVTATALHFLAAPEPDLKFAAIELLVELIRWLGLPCFEIIRIELNRDDRTALDTNLKGVGQGPDQRERRARTRARGGVGVGAM